MFRKRILKYCLLGAAAIGTAHTFTSKQDINHFAVVRWGRSVTTVAKILIDYKLHFSFSKLDPNSREYFDEETRVHRKAAERLLDLCIENKGIFIKVGQHVASLEYMIPKEYFEVLRVLHSDAPPSPMDDIYDVIREEFHKEPEEIFSELDTTPLGVASLAQVHKARLKDGRWVAVKVQLPFVQKTTDSDLNVLQLLTEFTQFVFPVMKLQWLVQEVKEKVPKELDFVNEVQNMEKAKTLYKHLTWLKIPDIVPELSTKRVLTMEFVEGRHVDDYEYMVQNKIDVSEVCKKIGTLYGEMIFKTGVVHSDPHPGNILVDRLPDGGAKLILLDHGQYTEIGEEFRLKYAKLWLSILDRDEESIKQYVKALGGGDYYEIFSSLVTGKRWPVIAEDIILHKTTESEKEVVRADMPYLFPTILAAMEKANRDAVFVFKANDLIRTIEWALHMEDRMSSYYIISKFCVRSIYSDNQKRTTSKVVQLGNELMKYLVLTKISIYYFCLFLHVTFLNFKHVYLGYD